MSKRVMNLISKSALSLGLILIATACGQKVNGTYSLTQTGGQFTSTTNGTACSQISLSLTSNSSMVTATGANSCYNETLSGTDNGNGTITVTSFTVMPVSTTTGTYSNYGGQSCSYTGTLTVTNNIVSGTLTPSSMCMAYGPITINGTKLN